jgi:hypothetical protein
LISSIKTGKAFGGVDTATRQRRLRGGQTLSKKLSVEDKPQIQQKDGNAQTKPKYPETFAVKKDLNPFKSNDNSSDLAKLLSRDNMRSLEKQKETSKSIKKT